MFYAVCVFFISKSTFDTIRVSNNLDPDQARHFVRPDLGPYCLQRLSTDDDCWQRLNLRYSAENEMVKI